MLSPVEIHDYDSCLLVWVSFQLLSSSLADTEILHHCMEAPLHGILCIPLPPQEAGQTLDRIQ